MAYFSRSLWPRQPRKPSIAEAKWDLWSSYLGPVQLWFSVILAPFSSFFHPETIVKSGETTDTPKMGSIWTEDQGMGFPERCVDCQGSASHCFTLLYTLPHIFWKNIWKFIYKDLLNCCAVLCITCVLYVFTMCSICVLYVAMCPLQYDRGWASPGRWWRLGGGNGTEGGQRPAIPWLPSGYLT